MASTKLSEELWADLEAAYRGGAKVTDLAEKYGVSTQAIYKRRTAGKWEREIPDEERPVEDEVKYDPEELAVQLVEAEAKIAAMQEKLDAAEAEAEALSPYKHVDLPRTAQDVLEFHGMETMREMAYEHIAFENMARAQRGLPAFDYRANPQIIEDKIQQLAQHQAERRNRPPSEIFRQRVVKMVKPNGTIVQWPVEEQISNEAGQAGASIWKAKEKGLKLLEPYICQVRDCWQEAEIDDHGQLTLNGYCSPEHRALDPYLNQGQPNVATSRAVQF